MRKLLCITAAAILLVSCASRQGEKPRYAGLDSVAAEKVVSEYVSRALDAPLSDGQKMIADLFDEIVAEQQADSTCEVYRIMTEAVAKYLYDPQSPLRDEDLYLPFAEAAAASPLTDEDARPGYAFQARMCGINRRGAQVADFTYRDAAGQDHRLYDLDAECIVLYFSNPGCHACAETTEQLSGLPYLSEKIAAGRIAVLNIYIDSDLESWRRHLGDYPSDWIVGYDPAGVIRSDTIYYIRAIPSVYVLDSLKRVVLKDAPEWRYCNYINSL